MMHDTTNTHHTTLPFFIQQHSHPSQCSTLGQRARCCDRCRRRTLAGRQSCVMALDNFVAALFRITMLCFGGPVRHTRRHSREVNGSDTWQVTRAALLVTQEYASQCPSGEDKARLLLFVMDPGEKIFRVSARACACLLPSFWHETVAQLGSVSMVSRAARRATPRPLRVARYLPRTRRQRPRCRCLRLRHRDNTDGPPARTCR